MDCQLARQLLIFDRPGELAPEEAVVLHDHLARCPECAEAARRQAAFDHAVAVTMGRVDVPAAGRRLALERIDLKRSRNWRRRAGTALALAASLLVAAGLGLGGYHRGRPVFDVYELAMANERNIESPALQVGAWLGGEADLDGPLPADFDFVHYAGHGTETVQGVDDVAVITFVRQGQGARLDLAKAYLVPRRHFRLDGLKPTQTSVCTVTVLEDARLPNQAWVVVHTTPTLEPFLKPRPIHAARAARTLKLPREG